MSEFDYKSPSEAEIREILADAQCKRAEYFRDSIKSAIASARSLFQMEDDGPIYTGAR